MELISLFFLVLVVLLGVITSYTDIRFGKIRNKWILIFGIVGLVVNLVLFGFYYFRGGLNFGYALEFFSNMILAFAVGFLFYYFDVWSAGDGKLFGVFAILVPLSVYSSDYVRFFPAITLLLNIFLIAFLVLVLLLVVNIIRKGFSLKGLGKEVFSEFHKKVFKSAVQIFVISWGVKLLLGMVGISLGFYGDFFLMFAAMMALRSVLIKHVKLLLLVVSLRLIFDLSIYSMEFLVQFLIYLFLFHIFKSLCRDLLKYFSILFFSKKVGVKELREGMVLSDVIVMKKKLSKEEKKGLVGRGIEFVRHGGKYYVRYPNGKTVEEGVFDSISLGKKNIRFLRQIGFKEYVIAETISFALFISLGVLVSYFIGDNLISFVAGLLQ